MSSFANSQALYQTPHSTLSLRKKLSLDTSLSSTKRGLSLVSSRTRDSTSASKRSIIQKNSLHENTKGAKFEFFKCSVPMCEAKKLTAKEELMQLKPKKIFCHNLRQRNKNILSKAIIDNGSSTHDSFYGSKVQKLWNIQSPVNRLL